MPRFAANLSLLFTELPLPQRFAAARAEGFSAVEIQFPYSLPAGQIAALLQQHDLQLVLHNLPAGNLDAGERGIACDPARIAEFHAGVAQALSYARRLKVTRLNCLAGIAPPDVSPALARSTLIANLHHAASQLQPHGITLLLEAINTIDIPRFFVCHSAQMADIIAACEMPNIRMQYDIYHMTCMQEDVQADLRSCLPLIGHIQIADAPGRGEPGTGSIDFGTLLPLLDTLGYTGWVGCEYLPQNGTRAGLGWLQLLAASQSGN